MYGLGVECAADGGGRPNPGPPPGKGRVRLGVELGALQADWPAFLAGVRLAEALGIDSVWVADHPTERPHCWATLAVPAVGTPRSASAPWWPASTTATLVLATMLIRARNVAFPGEEHQEINHG